MLKQNIIQKYHIIDDEMNASLHTDAMHAIKVGSLQLIEPHNLMPHTIDLTYQL